MLPILLVIGSACAGDFPRNQSLYLAMRDGVQIAIDVWLPEDLASGESLPTLIQATRYWRAMQSAVDGIENDDRYELAQQINGEGYAFIFVDARGSGASTGSRTYERSVEEATDYGEVIDWIIEQPWSNGRVGTFGVSYAGNTAELAAINQHPALKAVAPLFNDFDNYGHLAFPGGAFTEGTLERWGNRVNAMDRNDICAVRAVEGDACRAVTARWMGVKLVDTDTDKAIFRRALVEHKRNVHPFLAARAYQFRDDPWGAPDGVRNSGYLGSPAGHLDLIESSGVPMFVRAGWQDAATVNGTLGRYMTISNPQQVFIGPWDHGARNDADPFNPPDAPVRPSRDEQDAQLFAFFDRYLKGDVDPIESSVTYYTLGADRWTTTAVWPPEGFQSETWYLADAGALTIEPPTDRSGADDYRVDFTATTGRHNRWFTNNGGGGDVVYNDCANEHRKLLVYDSSPFAADIEITGHPIVTLFVSSTHDDGLFIVYLEDVAPDGTVTYITEGQLRAMVRKISDEAPPYRKLGPHRAELRADARPLVAGEVTELTFELWATSVLIREGHRLRIAIAGADADTFARYPLDGGEPTISVQRNAQFASKLSLPIRRRRAKR